ncbi:hypothetical protein BH23GEM11_BH23GEM11_20670 [soil metagenome]
MNQGTVGRHAVPVRMDPPAPLPHHVIIGAGLLVGVAGNLLAQGPGVPGLSMFAFFGTLAIAIGTASRWAGQPPSREAWAWIGAGLMFASVFVLRASPGLQFVAFLGASAAFAFPAFRAGGPWIRRSGVMDQIEAMAGAAGYAGLGAFRLATRALVTPGAVAPEGHSPEGPGTHSPRLPALLRGILLAVPLLFVFGALFVSADRVFAEMVEGLLGTALEEWLSHVLVTGIVAWLATGYLTGFLTGTRVRDVVAVRMRRPTLGIVEIGIAMGLLSVLFSVFIAVQFRYLFGGAGLVEVTPGLTYAEYAREGFGQLALVSALVIPMLLVSDWLLGRPGPRAHATFRILGSLQLLLLFLVILSAFQRVRAYQEAYGLTESRFYGVVFLGWLTLVSFGFGLTVLRGRREQFAFPMLLSALVVMGSLSVANPDAWIVRSNLARAAVVPAAPTAETPTGSPRDRNVDIEYLASLSADAVPVLLEALPRLPHEMQCHLAGRLLERWGAPRESDWRSWNVAMIRAGHRVRAEAPTLQRLIDAGAGCTRIP